ncbi:MAG: hypothetical protein K8R54_02095 [Bacteroidales bacterium]|nr:hypothetical protein [Bacteroidales bacterium]
MDYSIDVKNIEQSFDRIATDLLRKSELIVNDVHFKITEIEFYYFHEELHPDNYTHEHNRNAGEWRFHNRGLDITLQSVEKQDGGIFIRGLMHNSKYVNGPRRILIWIFEQFGKVNDKNSLILQKKDDNGCKITKTFRHLPNKIQDKKYHNKYYRYLTNLDELDMSKSIKAEIKQKSKKI